MKELLNWPMGEGKWYDVIMYSVVLIACYYVLFHPHIIKW